MLILLLLSSLPETRSCVLVHDVLGGGAVDVVMFIEIVILVVTITAITLGDMIIIISMTIITIIHYRYCFSGCYC